MIFSFCWGAVQHCQCNAKGRNGGREREQNREKNIMNSTQMILGRTCVLVYVHIITFMYTHPLPLFATFHFILQKYNIQNQCKTVNATSSYVYTCSTHIIQITWINLRGGEHNAGISDDGGRVRINTATPTVKEKTRKELSLVLSYQQLPAVKSLGLV